MAAMEGVLQGCVNGAGCKDGRRTLKSGECKLKQADTEAAIAAGGRGWRDRAQWADIRAASPTLRRVKLKNDTWPVKAQARKLKITAEASRGKDAGKRLRAATRRSPRPAACARPRWSSS